MTSRIGTWWSNLPVHSKVTLTLLTVLVPIVGAMAIHVHRINQLQGIQADLHQLILAREQSRVLQRLAVDIEDAFRGYLLTSQDKFLKPLQEAESRLDSTVNDAVRLLQDYPRAKRELLETSVELRGLLTSKHRLIQRFRSGDSASVVAYVRSGQGLELSDSIRRRFRAIEDELNETILQIGENMDGAAATAFWGLALAVLAGLGLGVMASRMLTRSITQPLSDLGGAVLAWREMAENGQDRSTISSRSNDEIGKLARSFEEMVAQVRAYIRELEAIGEIGHEINSIGPEGLEALLNRITDRATALLQVDVCLLMLRNERMRCWVVEAASGPWSDKLRKTVMLWEEFPVSVQAFQTGQPAIGTDLRADQRQQVLRSNLLGESVLSIPLLAQGHAFGVLTLIQHRPVPRESWNVRLATGFAEEVATAIANGRLYEALERRGKSLEQRVHELEHLAENLAHDLRGPGERMRELGRILLEEYRGRLDERGTRWLSLLEQNGREMAERAERILEVAKIGIRHDAVEAIDPALVISDVLKSQAGDLDASRVTVQTDLHFPMVACHRAYLYQVFDNLLSNAVKFSAQRPDPTVRISARCQEGRVQFSVSDNGVGIPPEHRGRVFEPFVRLQPEQSKGSGIGLAIVQRIVELYGGRVWIEPNAGGGCTVAFTLPALGSLAPPSASTARPCEERR